MKHGHLVEARLVTLVLCMGVLAVGGRRRTLITGDPLGCACGRWQLTLTTFARDLARNVAFAARLVFLAFIVANLLVSSFARRGSIPRCSARASRSTCCRA